MALANRIPGNRTNGIGLQQVNYTAAVTQESRFGLKK